MINKLITFHKAFWIIVVILFAVSLGLPTYANSGWPTSLDNGLVSLIFGFFYFPSGGIYLTWLANPCMILVFCFNYKKPKNSFYLSIVAFIIALNFLRGGAIDVNEAGHKVYITGFGLGYWFWLSSMVVATLASFLSMKVQQKDLSQ